MNGPADSTGSQTMLSLAVGVQGAHSDLVAFLDTLQPEPGVEILICHASDDPQVPVFKELAEARKDLRLVPGASDALIPEMWRDGFVAAQGTWVATLTSHCPPRADWLARALSLINTEAGDQHAAFGGAIIADPDADAVGLGVHLLRYADAGAARPRVQVSDISADNALYHRAPVMACSDLLPDGFWEPNYHRRFLAAGLVMEHIPDLVVVHKNHYSAAEFRHHRRRHGRVFGRHRSAGQPRWMQWVMALAAPAAFPVFAFKQTRKVLSRPEQRSAFWHAALPFYGFLASWCVGEAYGYVDALRAPRGRQA